MGKHKNKMNKAKKSNNKKQGGGGSKKKSAPAKPVFKVAGARSLKAKNKTRKLNLNLKKIKSANRSETEAADQQLNKVEETLRQTSSSTTSTAADQPQ